MTIDLSVASLSAAYAAGELTPASVCNEIRRRAQAFADRNIWISLFSEDDVEPYIEALRHHKPDDFPLWGIPFAMKDNMDLAGHVTTAACESFAYHAGDSAFVVQRLIEAGAIPVGKTNLDQFATGLNGTRSPWGACANAFDAHYISGGSSAGSAVAVALGLASFSLGTDTAGSGRVPACFNNLIGLKPSRGLLSARGVVPACRTLDCVSIFALNSDDANRVLASAEGFDADDGYSRQNPWYNAESRYGCRQGELRLGILPEHALAFFDDADYEQAYRDTLESLAGDGFSFVEIDYRPFDETAKLLYEGPWVSERYVATQPLIDERPETLFPVVRDIIAPGGKPLAAELFRALYRLQELRRRCETELAEVDCLLTPTAGRLFTIEEMLAQPVLHNSQLGYYTNFVNLIDMAAVAVPTAITARGLPFGITVAGQAFTDRTLLSIANRIQQRLPLPPGALNGTPPTLSTRATSRLGSIDVVVCGAHLSGMPLNHQLTDRGASLVAATQTSATYRLYELAGGCPHRPALVHDAATGQSIEVEVWSMPHETFGSFVAGVGAPLGIGKVTLADGRETSGFICESRALDGATDITQHGGWRAWRASIEAI